MRIGVAEKSPIPLWGSAHAGRHRCNTGMRKSSGLEIFCGYDFTEHAAHSAQKKPSDGIWWGLEAAARKCPEIAIDPDIMEGQPCIAGTRVPVRSVLRAIEQSGSVDGVVVCYPHLTIKQVKDALYFSQVVLERPRGSDEIAVANR